MSECLIDYIGLQGCSVVDPPSGLFVNSLPGISLKSIDNTADAEQVNYQGVWDDVQVRATRRLFTKIKAEFSKRYRIKNVTQSVDLLEGIDTASLTALAAKYRGFIIDLDNFENTDGYVASNFQEINIQHLMLYLPAAVNTTIKIFNLNTGVEEDSFSVTGAIGWNTVQVNTKYTARKLFVAYNATLVNGVELDLLNEGSCFCNDCQAIIKGGESNITTTVFNSGVTRCQNTFGLSGVFSIQCSYNAFICANKETFANALWYLLGSELLFELSHSPRINFYTTINAAKAKELRSEFEIIFQEELMNAIDGIDLNLCDCCLECHNQVIIKENMP